MIPTTRPRSLPSDQCSRPQPITQGPHRVLPTYPSSTLQFYYPHSPYVTNAAHISTFPQPFPVQFHDPGNFGHMPLPSASQSHVPSLRHTPSVSPLNNINFHCISQSPFYDQRLNNQSRPSSTQRNNSLSPIAFAQPHIVTSDRPYHQNATVFAAPQPRPLPPHPILSPQTCSPRTQPLHTRTALPYLNQHTFSFPSFPSTKDIPILTGKHDWGRWHSAVRSLILNANLLGHIADDPFPGALYDPGLSPTYPPVLHRGSTHDEVQTFTDWWSRDGLASHVLTSRLSPAVLGCLPVANERMGHRRSARAVYTTLRHQFGAGDYSAVMVIEARLRQLKCLPTRGGVRTTDFISIWRTSVNQMEAAGFLPGIRQLLSILADGLPQNTVAFINLYDNIISSLNKPDDQLLPNIHQLFDRIVHIENNLQRNRIMNPTARRPPPLTPTSTQPTQTLPPARIIPSTTTAQSTQTTICCSNCGRTGHGGPTCFQPGGAMEGRREEYLASRLSKPMAHIAEVEGVPTDTGENITTVEDNPLSNEFAALSLNTSNDILFSTYALSGITEIPELQSFALSSISPAYNSALDSACTNHIFRDRGIFHTYDTDGAVPVKTANCGLLTTLAIGDVKVRLTLGNKVVTWTLRNCLHAPDVPINLISVGALQEHRMSVVFSFQKTTIIFPSDHPQLSTLSFDAHVNRRLSLLNLDFILPQNTPSPVAMPLFTNAPISPDLWHRRFGHLGHEASKSVINGNYATGITKPPTPYPVSSRCIPCLFGKSPQAPYQNNAKRALEIGELVHVDTCGPFPTLTPKKEAYFIIFLDDASNYGVTTLLSNKNGAFQAWKTVEASWELNSGNLIKAVRLDGAKEFTQGSLSSHFLSRGIAMQVTTPYAHAQAGKAERYVRTIEDGVQTLLGDAKLPLSFWGDAALTTQYHRNRLPTSALPLNVTPYERMHNTKPDLSHLRVWGCQCFPAIPPEIRTKGGPRRYEAIFVGYEEN